MTIVKLDGIDVGSSPTASVDCNRLGVTNTDVITSSYEKVIRDMHKSLQSNYISTTLDRLIQ